MTFFQDPRDYQISVLSGLLVYGLLALDFDIGIVQVVGHAGLGAADSVRVHAPVAAAAVRSQERADLRAVALPAAAHELSVARAGRGAHHHRQQVRAARAATNTSSTRPTSASSIFLLTTNMVWVSPGQWGNVAFFGFLMACLGGLVVHRALRSDVAIAFALCYAGLLFGRSFYLGEPMAIPIHRLQSGGLLLFTFFMISDPRTTPDSRAGRFLFAALVAFGAWYVQFRMFRTNGLLWSLAACSLLTPIIDWLMPGNRYQWNASSQKGRRWYECLETNDGHVTATPAVLAIASVGFGLGLRRGRAGVLRVLRLEGRFEDLQQGLEGRHRPRRRSHDHDDVERLQGRTEGVRGRDSGADDDPEGSDSRRRTGA